MIPMKKRFEPKSLTFTGESVFAALLVSFSQRSAGEVRALDVIWRDKPPAEFLNGAEQVCKLINASDEQSRHAHIT